MLISVFMLLETRCHCGLERVGVLGQILLLLKEVVLFCCVCV